MSIPVSDRRLKKTAAGFELMLAGNTMVGRGATIQEAKVAYMKEVNPDYHGFNDIKVCIFDPTPIQVQDETAPMKFDHGKLDWSLLPEEPLVPVVKVLMFGCKKYKAGNWKKVPRHKLYSSLRRHIFRYFVLRERLDTDSGESHLACAICNLLFLLWGETKGEKVWLAKDDHENKLQLYQEEEPDYALLKADTES